MLAATATSTALCLQPPFNFKKADSIPRIGLLTKPSKSRLQLSHMHFSLHKSSRRQTRFYELAASFSSSGYREKVVAIIGVKVYAAGLYLNQSITSQLNAWQGQPIDVIQGNSSLFKTIYQYPFEKSLQIILVRDVDGKTFWDALDEAISPRIKAPTPEDDAALSTFCSVFQNRSLKKGTFIFLTWMDPSKLLVFVSFEGLPSAADAAIESANVASALFDVFFGDNPVSPTLKASVTDGLSKVLK